MSKQEVVNGSVPVTSVLIERHGVPPCAIETSISKPGDFCQYVE